MIFVGIALVVAAVLAVFVGGFAPDILGITEPQSRQLVPLIIVLVFVVSGFFGRRQNWRVLLTGAVLWTGIFAVAMGAYAFRNDLLVAKDRMLGVLQPGTPITDPETGTVSFQRGYGGAFRISGAINGAKIQMIFDTGATAVVLSQKDAVAAGVVLENLRYIIPVETANGRGKTAPFTLSSITIGGITRQDVRAFIAEEDALETSLLGMTFLETLSGYTVRGDSLVLHD